MSLFDDQNPAAIDTFDLNLRLVTKKVLQTGRTRLSTIDVVWHLDWVRSSRYKLRVRRNQKIRDVQENFKKNLDLVTNVPGIYSHQG